MKGKLRILGHVGLALFVACALMLAAVPAQKVEAATAVTEVWVEFPAANADGDASTLYNLAADEAVYRIHFKPNIALVRGVDTITVQFPDGVDTTMGASGCAFTLGSGCSTETNFDIDADAAGTAYTYYDCTAATYGGKRITVTTAVDIAAGQEAWLMIDDASQTNMVIGAASTSAYKVRVHTSKDTTPVLSKGFYLGTIAVTDTTTDVSVSPVAAGAENAEYTCTFKISDLTPDITLTGGTDTITVTFPYGTTLPSTISASAVKVWKPSSTTAGDWHTCGQAPTIDTDLRTATVTIPSAFSTFVIDDGTKATYPIKVQFLSTAGITNPTTAYAQWGADGGSAGTASRVGFIRTSQTSKDWEFDNSGYAITSTTATKLNFNYDNTPTAYYSDKYTMINMYSSPLYLQVEDAYGNLVSGGTTATAEVTLSPGSNGAFFYDSNRNGTTGISTINGTGDYTQISTTENLILGALMIYYKNTTAGTYTLTASYGDLTDATQTMQVCPGVSLYDRYDNLINTYAPTSSLTEETNATAVSALTKGGYYVQQAIDAATTYDTVKLGDGTYEVTAGAVGISLGKAITLTSVNGADYTTIDGTAATVDIIYMTGTNGTIDGLTIKGSKTATTVNAIDVRASSGFTIQNNKLVDIPFDMIFVNSCEGAITSGTITNNTITGIGRGSVACKNGIIVESSGNKISGVKVTNNTISANYGQESNGIGVAQVTGAVENITVQGNTISGCYRGISLWATVTGMTGTRAIANNTITGCVYGVKASGSATVAFDLVKNTITGHNIAGVYFYDTALTGTTVDIKYNDLSGNGSWGIYNIKPVGYDVVAKYNYWGDATGPGAGTGTYASLTARGSGDNVSREATYEPWLHKSLTDVVADNVSYQAAEMKLVVGWNTLSTPVQLIEAANSVDELISADDMEIGYYYDATGWHVITTGKVLNACDTVYVKITAVTYALFKFDAGAWTMPSKDLTAGWNLISLASLDASKDGDDAVASVKLTAANLPGYSQVISPSMNANQTDIYGVAGANWAFSSGESVSAQLMRPGLGYWIYMQNAATLAGFEITPIAPAFGLD